jgi:hypothetical protein
MRTTGWIGRSAIRATLRVLALRENLIQAGLLTGTEMREVTYAVPLGSEQQGGSRGRVAPGPGGDGKGSLSFNIGL